MADLKLEDVDERQLGRPSQLVAYNESQGLKSSLVYRLPTYIVAISSCILISLALTDLEDLTDVVEAMEDVAVNYGSIGLALRIKYSQIEIIERSCHGDARLGLRKVLKQWLSLNYNRQKETSNPSWPCWRKVVEVVDKGCAGHNHALAKKIADKHPYVGKVC